MNHADFCVIPSSLANRADAMPFLWDVISQMAANHLRSGSFVSSKIVPTLIEKRFRQSWHLWVFLSEKCITRLEPQCGQYAPPRQRICRRWSMADCSSGKASKKS